MNTSVIGFNSSSVAPAGVSHTPVGQQTDHQRSALALAALGAFSPPAEGIPGPNVQRDLGLSSEEVIRQFGGEELVKAFDAQCKELGLEGDDKANFADHVLHSLRTNQSVQLAKAEDRPLQSGEYGDLAFSIARSVPVGGAVKVPTELEAEAKGNVAALQDYIGAQSGRAGLLPMGRLDSLAKGDPNYDADPTAALDRAAGAVLEQLRADEAGLEGIVPKPVVSEDGQEVSFSNGNYDFKVTHGETGNPNAPPAVVVTNRLTGEETTVPCDMVDGAVRFEMENGVSIRIDTSCKEDKVSTDSVTIMDPDDVPLYEISGFGGEKLSFDEPSADTLEKLTQPAITYYEQPGDQQEVGKNWVSYDPATHKPTTLQADATDDNKIGGPIKTESSGETEEATESGTSAARLLFLDKLCEMFGVDIEVSVNGKQYHLGDNDSAPDGALNPD